MPSPWPVLQSLGDHAEAIAALPAPGPFPVRTAIVSSERQAHALRRELIRAGKGGILGGTRFVGAGTLAREILEEASVSFTSGEEALRPARILGLLEENLPFEYFDLKLLRSTPGWPEAFAGAITDLEGAGLDPSGLPATSAPWRDVQRLWTLLHTAAGKRFTSARIYREATRVLQSGARTGGGPIFAAATGRESAVQGRFLVALPGVSLGLVAARPLRARHLERVEKLFGKDARNALEAAPLPAATATERDVLARHLFAPPELLADPSRPRSARRDGTVELTEHSGVEAEVEAAAGWVAREVLERKTPLEEVAVLVPGHEPLASMVASRISRLPWTGGPFPVHVAGGLPVAGTAGGARALALVRALRSFLPAGSVAAILPSLRAKVGDRTHLTLGEAVGMAWGVGTVGGGPANPEGALAWPASAAAREKQLAVEVAALDAEAEKRVGHRLRPQLDVLRAALPALGALSSLARLVIEDRPLSEIAPALLAFMETWLLDPGPGAPVRTLLADELEGARADAIAAAVRGSDALGVVEEALESMRISTVRFGEPAVYVGTLAAAAGLSFEAVRIIGLSEGALPSAVREDPVLPDRLRAEAGLLVPVSADRVLGQFHAFDRAIRSARSRVVLSAPHFDLERSDREVSSLLVEAGAALGRPDPKEQLVIPDLPSLGRTSFGPARADAAGFRSTHPVGETQWDDRAAGTGDVPPGWTARGPLDLTRALALRDRSELDAADGILGSKGPFPDFAGLTPEHPISASALEKLISCPLRYLRERVMEWGEPGGASPPRELDPLTYGSLFHSIAETFHHDHGKDFVAKAKPLSHWKKVVAKIAEEAFDGLRVRYPLVGDGVEQNERKRLQKDLETFLSYDWGRPLTKFVGVELSFDGVTLDAGGTKLHVHGYLDRVDVEGDHALVRDLKTGSDHLREGDEAGPTPGRDIQLGLYSLVAKKKAVEWGIPKKLEAAYAYVRNGEERAFRNDHAALEKATKEWLAVAAALLEEHSFPPTPDGYDCGLCPYVPVCDGAARAAAVEEADGAVGAFLALRSDDDEEETE